MRMQKWIVPAVLAVSLGARAEDLSLMPMYGGKKLTKQLEASNATFIQTATKAAGSKEKAFDTVLQNGWVAMFQKNDFDTAMRRFNQAWLLDSSRYESYWAFGVLHGMKGEAQESVKMLEKALKIAPKSARVMSNLGISYRVMADKEPKNAASWKKKSQDTFERAHKLDPKDTNLALNYGLSLYDAGKVDQAKPLLKQAKDGGEKHPRLDELSAKLKL